MRLTHCLLALAAFLPQLALAQNPTAPLPPCDGSYNIVRTSEIKPGMYQKFTEAVTAQAAWYKAAGAPDQITMLRVFDFDATTHTFKPSEAEAITFHVSSRDAGSQLPHNAAYTAFVALFRESSTIKSEKFTCMPKPIQ